MIEDYQNGNLSKDELLRIAEEQGLINFEELSEKIEQMRRQAILDQHPYRIWQNNEGIWFTYLPDEKKGRVFRKRKTKKEIEDVIIEFYKAQKENIRIREVFDEWSQSKLRYGEIQRQSYDRYKTDFERFFPNTLPICRKQIKHITEADLTDFIKTTIHDQTLSKKSFAGLRTLINGIFKYAKLKGYTEISITQFFGDLELPKNMFNKKIIRKEDEIFMEDEIPVIINYLKNHVDIWNMGLLLQFQTGMRIGEISALQPEDVYPDHIHVHKTEVKYKNEDGKWKVTIKGFAKTDAGNRDVYFTQGVLWTLAQIQRLNPNGEFLFMSRGKRVRENTFNKRLAIICNTLNMNHRSTHKIRKTYGTTLLDKNVSDSTVAEQMGHSDIATTRKFYYYSNKNKDTKLQQLNQAIDY